MRIETPSSRRPCLPPPGHMAQPEGGAPGAPNLASGVPASHPGATGRQTLVATGQSLKSALVATAELGDDRLVKGVVKLASRGAADPLGAAASLVGPSLIVGRWLMRFAQGCSAPQRPLPPPAGE